MGTENPRVPSSILGLGTIKSGGAGMRQSELEKLKEMLDKGIDKEVILEKLRPKRNGNGNFRIPEGGISQSEASRKYDIPQQTISRWVLKGYIPVLLRTNKEVYISEASLKELVKRYKENPGQGKKTAKISI